MSKFLYLLLLLTLILFIGCKESIKNGLTVKNNYVSDNLLKENNNVNFSHTLFNYSNSNKKYMFTSILNEKICPCNIYMTLAKCVQNLQICPSAILLVQWINDKLIKEDIPINVLPYILKREIVDGYSANPQKVKIDDYPQKGAKNPELTIIEFSDFECPQCKNTSIELLKFLKKYPKKVKIIFRHYPLKQHKMAEAAAVVAEAAANQGKFWEMHDALFKVQNSFNNNLFLKLAKLIGLNEEQFKKDINNPKILSRVKISQKEAETLKLDGTPFLYFNNRPYFSIFTVDAFELRMKMEAKRKSN